MEHVILIVGDPNNGTIRRLTKDLPDRFRLEFIVFSYRFQAPKPGGMWYWPQFSSAENVLDRLRPSAILMFEISGIQNLQLIQAARRRGVRTAFVDHGLKDFYLHKIWSKYGQRGIIHRDGAGWKRYWNLMKKGPWVFRNRRFIQRSMKEMDPASADALRWFLSAERRAVASPLRELGPELGFPDYHIGFSSYNIKAQSSEMANEAAEKCTIGFPDLAEIPPQSGPVLQDRAVLIDQPFVELEYLGWRAEYRKAQFIMLAEGLANEGLTLDLRLHPHQFTYPREDAAIHPNIRVLPQNTPLSELSQYPIVLGYYSTLLLPAAASAQQKLIVMGGHPSGEACVVEAFKLFPSVATVISDASQISEALASANTGNPSEREQFRKEVIGEEAEPPSLMLARHLASIIEEGRA